MPVPRRTACFERSNIEATVFTLIVRIVSSGEDSVGALFSEA